MIAGYIGLLVHHMHSGSVQAKPETSNTVAAAGARSFFTSREEETLSDSPRGAPRSPPARGGPRYWPCRKENIKKELIRLGTHLPGAQLREQRAPLRGREGALRALGHRDRAAHLVDARLQQLLADRAYHPCLHIPLAHAQRLLGPRMHGLVQLQCSSSHRLPVARTTHASTAPPAKHDMNLHPVHSMGSFRGRLRTTLTLPRPHGPRPAPSCHNQALLYAQCHIDPARDPDRGMQEHISSGTIERQTGATAWLQQKHSLDVHTSNPYRSTGVPSHKRVGKEVFFTLMGPRETNE